MLSEGDFTIFANGKRAAFCDEESNTTESFNPRETGLLRRRCRSQSGVPDDDDLPTEVLYRCLRTGWSCSGKHPDDWQCLCYHRRPYGWHPL